MTHASKSKRQRRAAIGNACVIPVSRSEDRDPVGVDPSKSKRQRRAAIGNAGVIPVSRSEDRDPVGVDPSKSKRQRRAAIGNACVIPVSRSEDRDPVGVDTKDLDSPPAFAGAKGRGNDNAARMIRFARPR